MSLENNSDNLDPPTRQLHMIRYISCELIAVCAITLYFYILRDLRILAAFLSLGLIIILLNLWLIRRPQNTKLCGHILVSVTLAIVVIANYMVRGGGIETTFSIWFCVIPLLAATLIGGYSFIVYSIVSFLVILAFLVLPLQPYYLMPIRQLNVIGWFNHLFAYLIIVTTLYSLLRENLHYEEELNRKNYILQMEKDKYHDLARLDQLTNLPNRLYFEHRLQEIIDTLPPSECATIFFMDLDNLKYVNDHFGHEAGDHMLAETAKRLKTCFRQEDFIARIGGDEFTAIVLHAQGQNIPETIAQRIIKEFSQKVKFKSSEYNSSISIGLATYPKDAKTVESLIINADLAMYAAKKIGGSNFQKRGELGITF